MKKTMVGLHTLVDSTMFSLSAVFSDMFTAKTSEAESVHSGCIPPITTGHCHENVTIAK